LEVNAIDLTPKPCLLRKRNKLERSNIARRNRVSQGGGVVRPQAYR
jgi:hypothetical protein